ncbi:MAG: AsmA-like C-terminal region-containing protein [Afipia sp.]
MQTTLLGLAIALILALIAALVGPYFVDWNQFRPQFEAEASRIIGAPVRVNGRLDALLLPTPTLRLYDVAVGEKGAPWVSAGKLDVEFSLGSLMRGDWRASELTLNGFSLDLGLDRQGRFRLPSAGGRVNLGSLTIDRMNLAGQIVLHDAASGGTLRMDDLKFSGEVRALAGSMRGEGSFQLLGATTPFRLSSGQTGDGKGTRVHFTADPGVRPLMADLDGTLTFNNGVPNFNGALVLARASDAKTTDKAADKRQPWKISSRIKASPSSAAFDQVEAAYGPDDNALRLTGGGDIRFGAAPLLKLALAARQLDADRLLATGAAAAEPLRLLPALRMLVTSMPVLPIPSQIELSADQIGLGGRPLQNVAATLQADARSWTIEKFEMRAPGATRVTASGVISAAEPSARFSGPVSVESGDPDILTAWLQGRGDATYRNQKPLRLRGEATVAADRIGLDGMTAEINGGTLDGRLALLTTDGGKSRLEAVLSAESIDVDAVSSLVAVLAGPQATLPDEARIVLDAGRAVIAGQEVKPAGLTLSYGPKTIALERIQIGDAGGDLAVTGTGSFDRMDGKGKLALDTTASSFARIGGVVAPFAPAVAERLNALSLSGPVKARLSADVARERSRASGRVVLDLDAPQIKGAVTLTAAPVIDIATGLDISALGGSDFTAEAKLSSETTAAMIQALGLTGVLSGGGGSAQFEASVNGTWGAPLQLKAKLSGAETDGELQGTGNPWAENPAAMLNLAVRRADISALIGGTPANASPISLSSRLDVAGNVFTFDNLDTMIGGSRVRGRLVLTRGEETGVDGEIGLDTLDLAAVTGLAFGAAGHDPSAPLDRGWLRGWRGKLAFQALSTVLPGGAELRPFGGAIKGDGQSLVLENVKGRIGGGEVSIDLDARQGAANQGTSFTARIQADGVDGTALRYRGLVLPEGKAALQTTLSGQGRSAAGLTGALSGAGTLALTDARIAGLDPRAFEAAMRASDRGQATDDIKLRDIVDPVLAAGTLTVPSAQIPFSIKDGRLRIETASLEAKRARVAIAGGYDLLADQADLRAIMSPVTARPLNGRPEIRVDLNGPPDRLVRTVDVAALSSWLGLRAIDRETRRLDQLERGVTPAPETDERLWEDDLPSAEPLPPSQVKMPAPDPRRKTPAARTPARPPVAANPPPASPPSVAPAPGRPGGNATVQPLPPPIDIRPAPGAMRLQKQRPAAPAGTF